MWGHRVVAQPVGGLLVLVTAVVGCARSGGCPDNDPGSILTVESPDGTVLFERMTGVEWEEVNPRSSCPTGSIAQISLEAL